MISHARKLLRINRLRNSIYGRLSHRLGVVLSDTQPLGILREVLGQRIHKQGIKIYTGTKVTKTEVTENGVAIEIEALVIPPVPDCDQNRELLCGC